MASTLTLLDVVNRCLRRQRLTDSNDEVLTDFTDDRLRVDVDMIIDAVNDTLYYFFDISDFSPYETTDDTITLVAGTREYATATGFFLLASKHMKNHTDGHTITEYPGGYQGMFEEQHIPNDYVGQPNFWVINPNNGMIRLDTAPEAAQAGDVYTYVYQKQLNMAAHTDTFPFGDEVVRALIPAFVQMYRRENNPEEYDDGMFQSALAMAIAGLHNQPVSATYNA